VRVRIHKRLEGVVQGVSLSHLVPGLTYDLDPTLGGYLVTVGAAEAVTSKSPALIIPLDDEDGLNKAFGGISVSQIAEAADRPGRKRRARRPKR
jgi:hypothetical protein